MAIANILGNNAGVSVSRPSVVQRAANDNATKISSDLLKTGVIDFVDAITKIGENLRNINEFSRKIFDGFKKAILSISNLEKDIRFKFTYLQKDIEASRNDFLTALKALSFADGDGEDLGAAGPDFVNKEGKSTPLDLGGGGIPPIIPPGPGGGKEKPKPGAGKEQSRPGSGTKPNERARPQSRLERIRQRLGLGPKPPTVNSQMITARRPAGTPQRVTPALSKPAAPIINIPGATVSMQTTPTPAAGSPTKAPAAASATPKPAGTPSKAPVTREQFAAEMRGSAAGRVGGIALVAIDALIGSGQALYEYIKYKETGDKQHLKNVYGIVPSVIGRNAGAATGAAIGAALGGPAAPLTALAGGIIGYSQGDKQATILGRALYNTHQEGMDFNTALKLETLRYLAQEQKGELDDRIKQMGQIQQQNERYGDKGTKEQKSAYQRTQDAINKLTRDNATALQAISEIEKDLERKKAVSEAANSVDMMMGGAPVAAPSSSDNPAQVGDAIETMSRNVQQPMSGMMALPAIQAGTQTETIGEGGTEGISGYPNFPLDASNQFIVEYQKQLFNPMGNVPTRMS